MAGFVHVLYSFLLFSALSLPYQSVQSLSSFTENAFEGPYLVGDPGRNYEPDPASGRLVSYNIVPLEDASSSPNRVRRQTSSVTIPEEGKDKSALSKASVVTKKPTVISIKESVNVSISSTTSASAPKTSNQPEQPGPPQATPSAGSNGTSSKSFPTVSTMKSVVVDVVPTKVSPTMKSFPGSKPDVRVPVNYTKTIPDSGATTLPPDSLAPFPDFPPDLSKTYNVTKNDTHKYYNSSYFLHGEYFWVDLDAHPETVKHELLSDAHRRAATVKLDFEFPFYGHIVQNVTIATGGFIYLGEQVHAWLAATQYVAPLMANFDSRLDNASVRYLSNASQFTVEWDNVKLHDAMSSGAFTFQSSLYKNGTIVFAYKDIPVEVKNVNDTNHPVKVGLSDAYITEKTLLFVKQKTIFEYDRVDVKGYDIVNGSAIIFTALPTCPSYTSCVSCTNHDTKFSCMWCPKANRCSDGTDRHQQDWIVKSCNIENVSSPVSCYIGTKPTQDPNEYHNIDHDDHESKHLIGPDADDHHRESHDAALSPQKIKHAESGMSAGGVITLLLFLVLIFGGGGWVLYAYHFPHTPSGQLLIKFRPSQWGAFRRGEARYTAASIHM